MLTVTTDNDDGINRGNGVNRWAGHVLFEGREVISTGYTYTSAHEAMGGATDLFVRTIQWASMARREQETRITQQGHQDKQGKT